MFKVVSNPTFSHPVRAQTPVDGGHREESFKATFRVLPVDQVERYALATERGTREFLQAAIVRVDEITDEADQPLPYSDALRDQLIAMPHVRAALARTYFEAVSKAKAGN